MTNRIGIIGHIDHGRTSLMGAMARVLADTPVAVDGAEIPADNGIEQGKVRIVGEHDGHTISQMHNCMKHESAVRGVICADGHLGYSQPVGGVAAYRDHISVSGVGYDIACGNLAVNTGIAYGDIAPNVAQITADIAKHISFGVGRVNDEKVSAPFLDMDELWRRADAEEFRVKARDQLGTVGSGNHYVDLFVETTYLDDPEFGGSILDCPVWVGVHFGSRGMGHGLATKYLKLGGGKDGIDQPPTLLDVNSELGQRYICAMNLAGLYAYAGREWVVDRVRRIFDSGPAIDVVHNHHNYAWLEEHGGEKLWVVRKGATPAFPGQRGFVGGSMGDDAVILEGVESPEAASLLYSTVHGAGRLFGRKAAKRTFTREQMDAWLLKKKVHVVGGDLDESPMAYRRLDHVLANHAGTVRVTNRLRPIGVVMAGANTFDPYKD